jgi:hypothetical protein
MHRSTILNLNPGERVLSAHQINCRGREPKIKTGRERKYPNNKRSR